MPSRSIAIGGRAAPSSKRPSEARWPVRARSARRSVAFPALGTGVGGFPLDEAARITVETVRDELALSPGYRARDVRAPWRRRVQAFEAAIAHTTAPQPSTTVAMSFPIEPTEEQRNELVEQVAREIQLRGLTSSAVHFLEASRPYRALGANAMLFFDPVLRGVFGGDLASATEILADDTGIELLDRPARGARRRARLGRLTARRPRS